MGGGTSPCQEVGPGQGRLYPSSPAWQDGTRALQPAIPAPTITTLAWSIIGSGPFVLLVCKLSCAILTRVRARVDKMGMGVWYISAMSSVIADWRSTNAPQFCCLLPQPLHTWQRMVSVAAPTVAPEPGEEGWGVLVYFTVGLASVLVATTSLGLFLPDIIDDLDLSPAEQGLAWVVVAAGERGFLDTNELVGVEVQAMEDRGGGVLSGIRTDRLGGRGAGVRSPSAGSDGAGHGPAGVPIST